RGHFQKALAGASQTGPGRQLRENIAAAYRESARALEATGDHERAVAVLKESLELDPENPPSIRLLGTVLRGAGRTRDAISFYELYLMYEPEDREMADELIQLYREVGDEAKAVGLASRFPAPSPAVSGQPPTLASTEEAAASPDSAIEDELAVARDDRERADVYLKWGKASSSEKDYPRATELLRKGLEMNPASRDLLLALAEVLRLSRKPSEARRLYETRLEIEPKDHAVRLLLAKLLVATGGSKDALGHLKQLSVEPSLDRALMLEAYNWLGIAHAQTNDYAAAEDAWNEVLKIDAQHANAHYNLGQVRERQLKFKEAIAAFEKAVEFGTKDPDYLRYLERLGMAYRQAGQRQAAVDVWKRLAAAAPAGSPLADRARRFQAEQGVTQREMEAATPSGARPAEASRWRRTEAATHARLPDAPAPKDAEFLTAAEKAFRQGAPDEAIRQYNNALNADPTNLDTYFKLGDLLHQKGAIAQERALFQQMLAQKLPPDLEQAARYRLQGLGDASASEGTVRQEIGR
ncbi:MAG: tetratricopeptide repeat protein, partial [Candidatus Wallbacteria bacterium]|nr:tetratricopeptide repeat protein [Candidatus Wallbacteria bacterium]